MLGWIGKNGTPIHCWQKCKLCSHSRNQCAGSSQTQKQSYHMTQLYHANIPTTVGHVHLFSFLLQPYKEMQLNNYFHVVLINLFIKLNTFINIFFHMSIRNPFTRVVLILFFKIDFRFKFLNVDMILVNISSKMITFEGFPKYMSLQNKLQLSLSNKTLKFQQFSFQGSKCPRNLVFDYLINLTAHRQVSFGIPFPMSYLVSASFIHTYIILQLKDLQFLPMWS